MIENRAIAALKHARNSRGLTLREMAVKCGVSAPVLSQMERGMTRVSRPSVVRVAAAYGLPVSFVEVLMGRVPERILERELDPHNVVLGVGVMEGSVRIPPKSESVNKERVS